MALKGELFSQDMVRALLNRRKVHTARPVKRKYTDSMLEMYRGILREASPEVPPVNLGNGITRHTLRNYVPCKSKYQPGDYMYARETWKCIGYNNMDGNFGYSVEFKADGSSKYFEFDDAERFDKFGKFADKNGWQPLYFMPREAARLFYRVIDVGAMNLNDVDEQFAREDGFEADEMDSALDKFKRFWFDTYGADARWMWVYWMERVSKEEPWNG
ncbi:hypothetical protein [Ethanoligenens sp.]|uniref:hypothetical protein n=1 Tax=Ethanoligenens sp. TaxID=2099655 RepID=UPI0039E92204